MKINKYSRKRNGLIIFSVIIIISVSIVFKKKDIAKSINDLSGLFHLSQARRLLSDVKYDLALNHLKKVITIHQDSVEAWEMIVLISKEINDEQLLLRALSKLSVLDQRSKANAVEFLKLARNSKQSYLAAPLLSLIIDSHPSRPEILHESALILISLGLTNSAGNLLGEAIKLNPENNEIIFAKSTLDLLSDNSQTLARATNSLEQIRLTDKKFSIPATINLINYFRDNNTTRALELLAQAKKIEPDNWALRLLELDLSYKAGEEELPLLFENILPLADSEEKFIELIIRVAKYQSPEAAHNFINNLTTDNITSATKDYLRLPVFWLTNDYNSILDATEDLSIRIDEKRAANMLLWRVRALTKINPTLATNTLNKFINKFSNSPKILIDSVELLKSWNLQEYTRPVLQRLVDSRGPYLYYSLVLLLEQAHLEGDILMLLNTTSQLLEIQPDNPILQFNFVTLALEANVNIPKAEKIAESLYRSYPNEPGLLHLYAQALAANGRQEKALELYDSLSSSDLKTTPIIFSYEALLLKNLHDMK